MGLVEGIELVLAVVVIICLGGILCDIDNDNDGPYPPALG